MLALGAFVLVTVGALLGILLMTEAGARFTIERLARFSDGALSIGSVAGRFSDEVVLDGIEFSGAGVALAVDRINVRIVPTNLLSGRLVVDRIDTGVIRYRRDGAPPPGSGDAASVSLPLPIEIQRASIEGLLIEDGDRSTEIERVILSVRGAGKSVRIQRFETRWQGYFLSAQGGLDWADGLNPDLIVSWSGMLREEPLQGSADISGRLPAISVEAELIAPRSVTVSGDLDLAAAPGFDLLVQAEDLPEAAVRGRFEPATQTLDFALQSVIGDAELVGDVSLVLASASEVTLNRFDIDWLDNRLGLAGRIDLSDAPTADLELVADLAAPEAVLTLLRDELGFDLGLEARDIRLDGSVRAALSITGSPAAPSIDGTISVDGARFADLPLAVMAVFDTGGPVPSIQEIGIEQFDLMLGSSRATLSGAIGAGIFDSSGVGEAALNLAADIVVADLAELGRVVGRFGFGASLVDTIDGSASARLSVGGTIAAPELDAALLIAPLEYGSTEIAQTTLAVQAGLYEGANARLSVQSGTAAWGIDADLAGRIEAGGWSGLLSAAALDLKVYGDWQLEAAAPMRIDAATVALDDACLVGIGGRVCIGWNRAAGTNRVDVASDAFDLAMLNMMLPEGALVEGKVGFEAFIDAAAPELTGSLEAAGRDLVIDVGVSEEDRTVTRLSSVTIATDLRGGALSLDAALESATGGSARLAMTAADLRDQDAAVTGRIDIAWPDLAAASLLSPEIGAVNGRLDISVDVGGSVANPEVSGRAALSSGRIEVPEWGVLIEDIDARAISVDGDTLDFSGAGFIDGKRLDLSGVTELDPDASWPTYLRLSGQDLPVARRSDLTVFASPDFDIEILLPRINVSGSVLIPEADIAVSALPEQAVRVSPDSVVHGFEAAEPARPLEVRADVVVALGDAVRYSGAGLNADLSGELRLAYQSGVSPVASGTLRLGGSYEAYGQSLSLERGELLFAGPLENPAIDVRAVREIGSTTVGIRLTGPLIAPATSIFSEPAMSEADALSYLMLGRPLSASNDAEAATLESTALALGLQQALPAVQRVGESLGLDELSIAANDLDAGALMAGKYLSPNLYLSYSYGLFNRLGGFLLRYEISDRLSLETRSGNEKSMDLLYSIEKE